MRKHPPAKSPNSFLQGQELQVFASYISSYIGSLRHSRIQLTELTTRYIEGGKGTPILFLHGFGVNKSYFRSLMKSFAGQGYRVIAPEVPGLYPEVRLPRAKHNLRNMSLWLEEFIDALQLEDFILLGSSLGASLAAYYSEQHSDQIRKLILLSLPQTFNEKGDSLKTVILDKLSNVRTLEDLDVTVSHCFYHPPHVPAVVKKRIFNDIHKNQDFIVSLLTDIGESQAQLSCKMGRISAPTLLISGEDDPVCPADFSEFLENQMQRAELHILAKSKHLTFIERHRLVLKIIEEFLEEPLPKQLPGTQETG